MKLWSFLAELFFRLLIPFGAFMAGKEAEKSDQKDKEIERAEQGEKAWANRPKSSDDALERLLDAANKADKP
jgi:hypothetical protein